MLTYLLGDKISVMMLDAYSSEARAGHRVPASRFLALIALTGRFDILDAILRDLGGKAIDYRDAQIFRLGKNYVELENARRTFESGISSLWDGAT
jgi:hypothetical protein